MSRPDTSFQAGLSSGIDDEWNDAEPGDSWCIPENVYHEVIVEEDSHVIELFSPIRPDYLPGEQTA
jgi:quercetin dioxygenase-like cupin family protein